MQRIVYAENETNYCARCQTGGKILADRALSRLLKTSWPRNIDEGDDARLRVHYTGLSAVAEVSTSWIDAGNDDSRASRLEGRHADQSSRLEYAVATLSRAGPRKY